MICDQGWLRETRGVQWVGQTRSDRGNDAWLLDEGVTFCTIADQRRDKMQDIRLPACSAMSAIARELSVAVHC